MGIKDLLNSEKGLAFLLLIGIFTAFVFAGMASVSEWKEIVLPVFGIYAGTKTVTSVGMAIAGRAPAPADPAPTPAAVAAVVAAPLPLPPAG